MLTDTYFSYFNLHAANDADSRANFHFLRQLFALGVFSSSLRSSDAQFAYCRKPNCRKYSSGKSVQFSCCWRPNCKNCSSWQSAQPPNEWMILAPLKMEFYRQPLSLLQLSRLQIRCAVGINEFERRVKTLRLPSALLTCVWRANEMLSRGNIIAVKSDKSDAILNFLLTLYSTLLTLYVDAIISDPLPIYRHSLVHFSFILQ